MSLEARNQQAMAEALSAQAAISSCGAFVAAVEVGFGVCRAWALCEGFPNALRSLRA